MFYGLTQNSILTGAVMFFYKEIGKFFDGDPQNFTGVLPV